MKNCHACIKLYFYFTLYYFLVVKCMLLAKDHFNNIRIEKYKESIFHFDFSPKKPEERNVRNVLLNHNTLMRQLRVCTNPTLLISHIKV